jgi:hypothetical protein
MYLDGGPRTCMGRGIPHPKSASGELPDTKEASENIVFDATLNCADVRCTGCPTKRFSVSRREDKARDIDSWFQGSHASRWTEDINFQQLSDHNLFRARVSAINLQPSVESPSYVPWAGSLFGNSNVRIEICTMGKNDGSQQYHIAPKSVL